MKPHVRYGHTTHSTAGGSGAAGGNRGYRRADDVDGVIEEYKLEEQLAPFYESTQPERNNPASVRCYLPPSTPPSGVKPALRTISIMETLSELTSAPRRRAPVDTSAPEGPAVQRRKKVVPTAMLDLAQWYPPKRAAADRVWDVPGVPGNRAKGRSVQDILSTDVQLNSSSSTHGYGSLERKRRRRPGARSGFAMAARRGETDWEREEDEEEEDGLASSANNQTVPHYPMVFQQRRSDDAAAERERERARQSYKPPTEWFKKKRPAQAPVQEQQGPVAASTPQGAKAAVDANKERGQTPDWIHKIFHVARRGHLLKLQRVVTGMEPTLVRNLADHRGNNLLHVLAGAGNADALAWLCSSFGPEMQDALLDENKRGLTPVVAAIQAGRLEALQFLVDHTSARERLAPVDGDRSLLHIAAKYGKIDLVAWLAQYMESHGFEIDLRDHCGHSPLHLAAKAGHASAVAILVAHGADVTAKNDMGHRPLDLASANGHVGVAQLLRLHDAALGLSSETLEATEELDNMRADYGELKSYFRDVLVIGKRFAKERDEMCRQMGRLYEDVTSLHQALLFELRTLHRDLAGVRDRVSSSRKAGEIADRNLDESVAVVEALHDKWQSQQRGWFSSGLADMEHRLLMAEDGWKRLRTSSGAKHRSGCQQIRPQDLLRSRLAAINAQASSTQCDVAALSSPEGSLYSERCHSPASGSDAEDAIDAGKTASQNFKQSFGRSMSMPATPPAPPSWQKTSRSAVVKTALARSVTDGSGTDGSVYGSLEPSKTNSQPLERKRSTSTAKQELRRRLQEVKLTSESGNASVIEVIEPSSSDDDVAANQATPLRGAGNARSFNASFSEELERARQATKRNVLAESASSSKSADPLLLAEPDLLAGTAPISSRSCHDLALPDDETANHSTRSHSSLSSSNNTAVTSVPRKKSSGFLTKFALKARWPSSKRKTSTSPGAESPLPANEPEPDVQLDEDSVSTHTVAGLSQMFEDMSTGIKTTPGVAKSSRSSAESDLPPSTSPPPVPLEIETYQSSSQQAPAPPPRFSKTTSGADLKSGATPSSSSSSSASHGGVESLSVAASEDSGIVMARPASSASSPRPVTYAFTTFSPLCKAAPTPNERLSPAPSDLSKAESTGASDLCKTESMRHFRQLARIEEAGAAAASLDVGHEIKTLDMSANNNNNKDVVSVDMAHQSGQILTWREAKLKNQVVTPPPLEERLNKTRVRLEEKSIRTLKKRHQVSERPWYDVSDDESDLLTPERLTKLKTSLSSSSSPSSSSGEEEIDV